MHPALKIGWLLMLSVLLWPATACAQQESDEAAALTPSAEAEVEFDNDVTNQPQPPNNATPPRPWPNPESQRPAAPDVYLLPDEFGKLRKVLGFRYEDFLDAWNRASGTTEVAPPSHVIDDLTMTGSVQGTHAQLRLEFTVSVQTEHWAEVPIQLPNLIVQKMTIEEQAAGESLAFDKERQGYVVWLSGAAGKRRTIVLEGLAKVKVNSGSSGIELYLPRATATQCTLQVPGADSRIECSPELAMTTEPREDNTTEVRVQGHAIPWRLNWSAEDKVTSTQTALVKVVGQTTVQLDRRRAHYDAVLEVDSFGSALPQIQVRLPKNARLAAGQLFDDYEVEYPDSSVDSSERQIVTIRRTENQSAPWKVRLSAEQTLRSFADTTECRVEGIEVLGAFQQSGTVTLEVADQLQAYFDAHGDIDQIPKLDSAVADTGKSILGSFRYTRFPWSLVVVTSPRQRRVSVKPQYKLLLSPEEARLDSQFEFQFTGAQIFSLRIDLHGWKLTDAPIESGGLIAREGVVETRDGFLVLPLVNPDTQQLRLNLSVRKQIDLGTNTFLPPEPQGAFVVDGVLQVDAVESLRVEPNVEEMEGLSLLASPEGEQATDELATPTNELRLRTFLSQPKFVAELSQKQREVSVELATQVELDQQSIHVRQQLDYLAKYRAVSQLSLDIPNQLWLNDSLTVTLGGEQLPLGLSTYLGEEPLDEAPDALPDEEIFLRHVVLTLPRPMQNAIPLEISYDVSTPALTAEEPTSVSLPLVAPVDRVSGHRAVVTTTPPVKFITNERTTSEPWVKVDDEAPPESAGTQLTLRTEESTSLLTLRAQLDSTEDQLQLATLERAWIQSWIASESQQQRAVFRFRTSYDTVFATLPPSLVGTEIEVLLDGEPHPHQITNENRLSVEIPDKNQRVSHTLELRYQQRASLPVWGKMTVDPPRLECRDMSAPIYWQLILPRDWQVASDPDRLNADYWLGWKNYRWGRQPTLSQADLEQITAAVPMEAPTPLSTQYVYRAFEIPTKIEFTVLRQIWLFVAGAMAAFAVGLLWLYTSVARGGFFWLVVACCLLMGIYSYPEITLLVIQSILTAGLMLFVASMLRQAFSADSKPHPSEPSYAPGSSAAITKSWEQQSHGPTSESMEATATLHSGGQST